MFLVMKSYFSSGCLTVKFCISARNSLSLMRFLETSMCFKRKYGKGSAPDCALRASYSTTDLFVSVSVFTEPFSSSSSSSLT